MFERASAKPFEAAARRFFQGGRAANLNETLIKTQ